MSVELPVRTDIIVYYNLPDNIRLSIRFFQHSDVLWLEERISRLGIYLRTNTFPWTIFRKQHIVNILCDHKYARLLGDIIHFLKQSCSACNDFNYMPFTVSKTVCSNSTISVNIISRYRNMRKITTFVALFV